MISGILPALLLPSLAAADRISQADVKALAALRHAKVPVVVYCACPAEITSLRMAQALSEYGIAGAGALRGGWVDWFTAGNPVESAK